MKIVNIILVLILMLSLVSCGNSKIIDGKEYNTYGLLNAENERNPSIMYKPVWGNIIWGSLLFGSVVAPVYFFGFSMFEPVSKKAE